MSALVLVVKEELSELTFKLKCNDKEKAMRGRALQEFAMGNELI